MQAEFLTAEGPTVWLLTPWMYEGVELPQGTADRMILQQLPFDSPTHPVFSCRSNFYQNAFEEYSILRLKHRLFRLLRTFCRHRTDSGEVIAIDKRLFEKSYGRALQGFLKQFGGEEEPQESVRRAPAKTSQKKDDVQMQLPLE